MNLNNIILSWEFDLEHAYRLKDNTPTFFW
jgi:hypothetical protein